MVQTLRDNSPRRNATGSFHTLVHENHLDAQSVLTHHGIKVGHKTKFRKIGGDKVALLFGHRHFTGHCDTYEN